MKLVVLWTDGLIFSLLALLIVWLNWFRSTNEWNLLWNRIYMRPRYLVALMVLMFYGMLGLLDSIHFKSNHFNSHASMLDILLSPRDKQTETTYSAPFALQSYVPDVIKKMEP